MCPCFPCFCMYLQFFLYPITGNLDLLSLETTLNAGAKDLGFPSVLCGHVSQPACNGGGSALEYQ